MPEKKDATSKKKKYICSLNHKWHTAHVYNQSTGYIYEIRPTDPARRLATR